MKKISEPLRSEISSETNKIYSIIVVLNEGADIKKLHLKEYNLLMKNILSTNLKSSEIKQLSKHDDVQSIELNEEAGIL